MLIGYLFIEPANIQNPTFFPPKGIEKQDQWEISSFLPNKQHTQRILIFQKHEKTKMIETSRKNRSISTGSKQRI